MPIPQFRLRVSGAGRIAATLVASATLAGCGTDYAVPEPESRHIARAETVFSQVQAAPSPPPVSASAASRRFDRVTAKVKPVAESLCLRETADQPGFDCDADIGIDHRMKQPNAYFTYVDSRPVIRFSRPILQDMGSDHELAFVLGHEYGHLIAGHTLKKRQQAMAGALVLGGLTALAGEGSDQVARNAQIAAALGSRAYSRTYELESDTLGTLITRAAGYDPVAGARFFARGEASRLADGRLSFWGTHPPDARRIATVLATVEQLDRQGGIGRH